MTKERPSHVVEIRTGPSLDERLEDKISAALLGGAIADAMGWVTEFIKTPKLLASRHGVDRISDFVSWEKKTGGRFNPYIDYVGAGEYSDDTQLTLCVARAVQPDGTVDNDYFATTELTSWLAYARGAGATITGAARALIDRKNARWNDNFFTFRRAKGVFDYRFAGANGAAMRIAPIAMANPYDIRQLEREIWRNSIVTHGNPRAVVGALVYGRALAYVIADPSPRFDAFLATLQEFTEAIRLPATDDALAHWRTVWDQGNLFSEFERELNSSKNDMLGAWRFFDAERKAPLKQVYQQIGCFAPATKGSATATVAAALAVFLRHGKNFEHAVIEAVNMLGSDTDTIAAMVGSLAGAHAGYSGIPERWARQMQDFPYFMRVAAALARVAERTAEGPELRHLTDRISDSRLPDVLSLASASNVATGQRVHHEVLGPGTIMNVHVQPFKSRRGGSMLFIVVQFDSGQTCKFKFFRSDQRQVKVQRRKAV
jgi:ADP-ribosylglycohydrolase